MTKRIYRVVSALLFAALFFGIVTPVDRAYASRAFYFHKKTDQDADPTPEPSSDPDPLAYFKDKAASMRDTVFSLVNNGDYWKVTLTDLAANPDGSAEDDDSIIVNVYLKWDAMNGEDRAKTMLQMFSDDIAFTIHEKYPDDKVTQLWCFWEMPYLLDEGYIAKYQYETRTDGIYRINAMGPLYGWD